MKLHILAVLIGCVLDGCFGDPHWLFHPVRAIGWLIEKLENLFRKMFPKGEIGEKKAGLCLVLSVLFISGIVTVAVLEIGYAIHPYVGVAVESILCYQMIAWRALRSESMKVYHELKEEDIEGARQAVSMIVGRDTGGLDDVGIVKAAVETVAENTSDGILAPLFFMTMGGGLGAVLYKAVNTMDSMVGYKNDRYLYVGRAAARLDDLCNYIPARLSAFFMIAAGYLCQLGDHRYSGAGGLRIFRRDRYNHKSPNSAQTEAVCAGVLQIELAGNAYYFGKLCEKPTIGDPLRAVELEDIKRANHLTAVAYLLALIPLILLFLI